MFLCLLANERNIQILDVELGSINRFVSGPLFSSFFLPLPLRGPDTQVIEKETKRVILLEMSCPWIQNRAQKQQEKTNKYTPLRWELRKQYPDFEIMQCNIIIDVLGGYSGDTAKGVRDLLGSKRAEYVLFRMQKAVLSGTLHIARTFKVQVR